MQTLHTQSIIFTSYCCRSLINQSVCHRAVMLLSDSTLDQSIVDRVTMAKQENDSVSLDIYTLIFGIEADDRSAALLSCSNGGDHFVVIDMDGVDEAIASYYQLVNSLIQCTLALWTLPTVTFDLLTFYYMCLMYILT